MRSLRRRRAGKTGLAGAATREDRAFDAGDATMLRLLEERFGSPGQPCFDRGLIPLHPRVCLPGSPREMRLLSSF